MANASILAAFERMWQHITSALNKMQTKHITKTVILTQEEWSDSGRITVNIDGVTEDNTIIVAPSPDSKDAYNEAGVSCYSQYDGSLEFSCTTLPESNLTVNIIILN
jgi:hypothetical protein